MGCEKKRFLNKFNYLAMNLLYSDGEGVLPSPELVGKGLIPPYIFKQFFYILGCQEEGGALWLHRIPS